MALADLPFASSRWSHPHGNAQTGFGRRSCFSRARIFLDQVALTKPTAINYWDSVRQAFAN
jgi:hypothetical protein